MEYSELEQLVEGYQPNAATIARLGKVRLLMVVGPSGVGKSTLVKASGLPEVIGDASRLPRPGEKNGVDYWFRTEEEMLVEIRAGRYVQIAVGAEGDIKATHASSFPAEGDAVFAVVASAVETFRSMPMAATTTAIIVPPDYDTWMLRLQEHGLTADNIAMRLREAAQSYHFALDDESAYFVLNDTVGAAVGRLRQAMRNIQPDDHARARLITEAIANRLSFV